MKETDSQSRIDASIPDKEATRNLDEAEKKQVELSGQIEHEHGEVREGLAEDAERLEKKSDT